MNFLSRFRLGTRLGGAFAIVILLALGVGVSALMSMKLIYQGTEEVAGRNLPATRALGDYRHAMNQVRRAESNYVMDDTANARENDAGRIAKAQAQGKEAWQRYVALVTHPEEKGLLGSVEGAQKQYFDVLSVALTMERGNAAQEIKARELLLGDSRRAVNALFAASDQLVAFQADSASKVFLQSKASYEATERTLMILLGLALAAGVGLAALITRSVTQPVAEAVEVAESVAKGDLTSVIHVDRQDEMGRLLNALSHMNDRLVDIVEGVRLSADSIGTGSAQIAGGNADLSQRTEEQASNLQETAASMDALTVTVKQNADTAREASTVAARASEAAVRGGLVVDQVVTTMGTISESSRRISDIIGVIDGIAFQTNILALNAAVEAARAGEQGRGFAVVAGEVRSLAQRSAQAAREIKGLIQESASEVQSGAALVADAGSAMQEIVQQARQVSDLIGEISSASLEQSSGIAQIGHAVSQLDQVTQQNAALVEQSAAAAESLKQQAAQLSDKVSLFKTAAVVQTKSAPPAARPIPAVVAPPASLAPAGPQAGVQACVQAGPRGVTGAKASPGTKVATAAKAVPAVRAKSVAPPKAAARAKVDPGVAAATGHQPVSDQAASVAKPRTESSKRVPTLRDRNSRAAVAKVNARPATRPVSLKRPSPEPRIERPPAAPVVPAVPAAMTIAAVASGLDDGEWTTF